MEELLTENLRLLQWCAWRYRFVCERDPAYSLEDLVNAGFFGLVEAQKTYDAARGSWAHWAVWHVKRAMLRDAGYLREADRLSLDRPIAEDAEETFLDVLPSDDPPVEEAAVRASVAEAVRAAVDRLKDARQRDVVRKVYLQGQTLSTTAAEMGCSAAYVQTLARKGLQRLAADRRLRDLDDRTRFHAYKGVRAFQADWTSVTEAAALWRIKQERRWERGCKTAAVVASDEQMAGRGSGGQEPDA